MENLNSTPRDDPRAEYVRRFDAWKATHSLLETRHRLLGIIKLVLGGAILLIIALALAARMISGLWVLAPLLGIVIFTIVHDRVLEKRERSSRTGAYYERALARLDDRWIGTGETGERFQNDSHPYSRDLDLFGKGSLFELLCTARTRVGQETLAGWLCAAAPPAKVRERNAAVDELRGLLNLREDLAVLAEEARALTPAESLAAWGEGAPLFTSTFLRIFCPILAGLWLASLVAWWGFGLGYLAVLATSINISVYFRYRRRVEQSVTAIGDAARDLRLLAGVLARLEAEHFAAPGLAALHAALESPNWPPSRWIGRLHQFTEYLDSRRSLIIRGIDFFVLWTMQTAMAIEAWRKKTGREVRKWLNAVGELEALASLGGYAYEHPADVFPEFSPDSPCYEAEGLAHPLLPEREAVRNDVHFGSDLRVLIVSGPNMAGKSTFVPAVGINAVLAQCGAPVRARRFRLSPLAVGASICVLDSLQGGISRFYAEIKRLKQITNLAAGPVAVLFLLDEFLQGTNSHDRRVGAEAMVHSLVERGAIGLVTTHDLALAEIAEGLGSHAANAHFQDRLEDGKLMFDYRLQPGIVQTSNALNLMRSIGLEV